MLPLIKRIFLGPFYKQEYWCLAIDEFQNPAQIYLKDGEKGTLTNITQEHLFLGYHPLIFSIPSHLIGEHKKVKLLFKVDEKIIATLNLDGFHTEKKDEYRTLFFEGTNGKILFLNYFREFFLRWQFNRKKTKQGTFNQSPGQLDQIRIAYSLPRKISLISLEKDILFNLFPTDLHGKMNPENYIISLRKNGKACEQVQDIKKILLTDIAADQHSYVYSLGKNHMRDLSQKSQFSFTDNYSEKYGLPVPNGAISYQELRLIKYLDKGIHRLLFFEIENRKVLHQPVNVLGHIHQWQLLYRYHSGIKDVVWKDKIRMESSK